MAKSSNLPSKLLPHAAAGASISEAAAAAGCSYSHAQRIMADADFKKQVSEFRTASLQQAVGALGAAASTAIRTLAEITEDSEAKNSDRIAAAKTILATLQPMTELHELRERFDKLQKQQLKIA